MVQVTAAVSYAGRLWLEANRRALLQLASLTRRLGRERKQPKHLHVGERGEFEALFFLRRHGYAVVERRWRSPDLRGDLDLIAWEGETLCLVEVKTRTARDFAPAKAAVDEDKQRMLRRMARAYRRTLPRETRDEVVIRFDVVSVYLLEHAVECELIRGAFPVQAAESAFAVSNAWHPSLRGPT